MPLLAAVTSATFPLSPRSTVSPSSSPLEDAILPCFADRGNIEGLTGEGRPGVEASLEAGGAGGEASGDGQTAHQRRRDGDNGWLGGMGDEIRSEHLV